LTVAVHVAPASDLTNAEVERWRDIPVAVAVDVGRAKGQIDPAIRPLAPGGRQPRLFGRAVTALCEPPDFGAVLIAIDRIGSGEVLVIAAHGHAETAMIGEILSGQLRRRGAVGVICDGAIRDVGRLAQWPDFSVFTRHVTPRGPWSAERGAVNAPVVVGGRIVRPGDLVIGDDDGLVALDPDSIRNRIGDAEAKLRREAEWQASLAAGRSMAETFGLDEAPAATDKPARKAP
jgi:4-hydroxy-4-methyl-2-oxoglutarate aldolase